jgi:hypothetical protein
MSSCKQKYFIVDYFFDELATDQKVQYESHLGQCELCQAHLDDLKSTASIVHSYERQQPGKEVLRNYHSQLKAQFFPKIEKSTILEKLVEILIIRPSIPIRLAEALVVLFVGIFIGKYFVWTSDLSITPGMQSQNIYQASNEALLLKNYLQETEMVFLDVANLDPIEDQKIIFNLIQSTKYQYLLQKTILLKDQAEKLENQQLQGLLNQIELILLELCNLEEQAFPETIHEIKQQLKKSYLLMEIKSIKHQEI